MLNHPVIPAVLLAIAAYRLFTGTATWFTAVSAAFAALWLVSAYKEWQAKRGADDAPPGGEAPRAPTGFATLRTFQAPPPPPTDDEILATAKPAIVLHRTPLPQPLDAAARSWLGGLPRLPPHLEWPQIEKYERVPLTFLAQIDLAELPPESNPLPRTGTLYFFADMNDDSPGATDCRVLFHGGDASHLPLSELPANARPYGYGGEPWPWLPETSVWSKTGFRFPLRFTAFDSVRDYVVEEGANMPPARNRDAFDRIMAAEFTRRFGVREPAPTDAWQVLQQDRDEWPFAWTAIEFGARSVARDANEAIGRRESEPVREELRQLVDAAAKWVDRASAESPHARSPDDVRLAFLADWRAWLAVFEDLARRHKVHARSYRGLFDVLTAACFVCASNGAEETIPEIYRVALAQMDDPAIGFPKHQMLGHGEKVQWAPVEHAARTLLLQLSGDGALGWHANGGCSLQFWIEPEALADADFGSVQMTLECD